MAVNIPEEDKARARHHLGYLGVEQSQTFVLGIPAGVQTQFMIEGALNRLLPHSMPRFLKLLEQLECLECKYGDAELSDVDQIAEIKINRKRLKEIATQYCNFRTGLANLLGIVPNPFDERNIVSLGDGGMNVSVQHG